MAVSLKKLSNKPEERRIRDVVLSGSETITIYEATAADVETIVELQESKINGEEDKFHISGWELVRTLFPMFTDIGGIEELSNEEIEDIIDNPTVALMQVQKHIQMIVTEIYKSVILSAKSEILDMDLATESTKAEGQIFDAAFKMAAKEVGAENILAKIDKAEEELDNVITMDGVKAAHTKAKKSLNEELEENNMQLKASNLVEQYRKDFGE